MKYLNEILSNKPVHTVIYTITVIEIGAWVGMKI